MAKKDKVSLEGGNFHGSYDYEDDKKISVEPTWEDILEKAIFFTDNLEFHPEWIIYYELLRVVYNYFGQAVSFNPSSGKWFIEYNLNNEKFNCSFTNFYKGQPFYCDSKKTAKKAADFLNKNDDKLPVNITGKKFSELI